MKDNILALRLIISFALISLTSTSCIIQDPLKNNEKTQKLSLINESLNPPSNVVKVLNSVRCRDGYCSQDQINSIWNKCLDNGYQRSSPNSKVISSREIKELIQSTVQYRQENISYKEITDSYGVVTQTPVSTTSTRSYTVYGYCNGSEYIVQ